MIPRALLLFALIACTQRTQTTPPEPAAKPVVFLGAQDGGTVQVSVELAQTPSERNLGLMNRSSLGENAGMLFLFSSESVHSFWMKNTLIPLDMIFIRSDMSVAGIVANAEPLTETSRSVGTPSQYVLEVNGGFAEKHGIVAGARVRFENVPAPPPY